MSAQSSLPSVATSWRIPPFRPGYLASQLFERYAWFAPGCLATALAVEFLGEVTWAGENPLLLVPFFALSSWWIVAAAARANGLTYQEAFQIGRYRAIDYFASILGVWVACFVLAGTMGVVVAVGTGYEPEAETMPAGTYAGLGLVAGLFVLAATRFWPFFVNKFLYRGEVVRSGLRRYWVGPGLVAAWRMTGREGAFTRCTLPVLVSAIGLCGTLTWLHSLVGDGLGAFVLTCVLWFVAVPFVVLVAIDRAAMLRLEQLDWID